jgi:general stress protein CsbA
MMMMSPHRHMHQLSTGAKVGGILLVLFAGVLITIEVMLHVMAATHDRSYSINYWMMLIALVSGFTGLYILSPPRAKDGGQFLVNNAIKIIQVVRQGRRKDDPVHAVLEDQNGMTTTLEVPVPPHDTEIQIEPTSEMQIIKKRRASDSEKGEQGNAGNH